MEAGALSGGPLDSLKRGWALMPFVGKRAHYWIEDIETMPPTIGKAGRVRYYRSLCGATAVTNYRVPALAHGSWPKCGNCLKQHNVKLTGDPLLGRPVERNVGGGR